MCLSREYPKEPLPGVLAAVVRNGKVLLVLRAKDPDKDKWGLPGGMMEAGETPVQAARRELFEETHVQAIGGQVIDQFEIRSEGGRFHYHLSVVKLEWQAGDGMAGSDAAQVGWFTFDDILELSCSQKLLRIAKLLLTNKA